VRQSAPVPAQQSVPFRVIPVWELWSGLLPGQPVDIFTTATRNRKKRKAGRKKVNNPLERAEVERYLQTKDGKKFPSITV
jgi:hypothetical protein